MALEFKDPPGRRTIAIVDSRSAIEVWDADDSLYRVEFDQPTRGPSVGFVHKPETVTVADWRAGVRRLLAGRDVDLDELLARLAARWR